MLFTVFFPFLLFPSLYNKSFSPLSSISFRRALPSHSSFFFLSLSCFFSYSCLFCILLLSSLSYFSLISSTKFHSFPHPTAFFLSSSICNESLSHLASLTSSSSRLTTRLHHRSVSTFHRQSNLYVGLFEGWLRTTPPQTRFQPPSSLLLSSLPSMNRGMLGSERRDILSLSFSI